MTEPTVSVIIPCHDERRWPYLVNAVRSVRQQSRQPAEVVVVVDHNEALLNRARAELTGVTVLANQYTRGVSGNRNTGAFHTDTELIALLDDDAVAHEQWLAELLKPFDDPTVVGTGGTILPSWQRRPDWFPDEFLWAVGGSYTGLPRTTAPIRNVWSASMAVRRSAFEAVDGFRVGFGKLGDRSRPEDTDLCLRMAHATGGHWMYTPDAVIWHPVPAHRSTLGYFLTRCYNEGRGKIEMARLLKNQPSLGTERGYLARTLPRAIGRGVADTVTRRDRSGWAKSLATVAGISAAGVGAFVESARLLPQTPEGATR